MDKRYCAFDLTTLCQKEYDLANNDITYCAKCIFGKLSNLQDKLANRNKQIADLKHRLEDLGYQHHNLKCRWEGAKKYLHPDQITDLEDEFIV